MQSMYYQEASVQDRSVLAVPLLMALPAMLPKLSCLTPVSLLLAVYFRLSMCFVSLSRARYLIVNADIGVKIRAFITLQALM